MEYRSDRNSPEDSHITHAPLHEHLIEQMAEGVLLVNASDGHILYANQGAERLFKYGPAELNGQPVSILHDPSQTDLAKTPGNIIEILKQKNHWRGTVRNLCKDGTPIWCSLSISTFNYPGLGEVWLGVHTDVDALKTHEDSLVDLTHKLEQRVTERTNELNRAKNMLQTVLNTAPFGIFWKDRELNYLGGNKKFAFDAGLSSLQELAGKSDYDLVWKASADIYRKDDADIINSGLSKLDFEEPMDLPDGSRAWLSTSKMPLLDESGNIIGILGAYHDITFLKQAESRLKEATNRLNAAQHLAQVGDYSIDLGSNTLEWSATAFELLGYPPDSITPSTEAFMAPIHPDDLPIVQKTFIDVLSKSFIADTNNCIRLPDLNYRVIHPDGKILWLHSEGIARLNQDGKVTGISGTVQNITQHKMSEQDLILAKEIAERASRAKNDFLARMSHELRTPMNAILGYSQLLEMEPLSEKQMLHVLEIHRAGTHLLELINELLDLSRIESGRIELKTSSVSLQSVLGSAIQLVQPLITQKALKLENNCPGSDTILADSTRLKQILVNLLSNAAKYNKPNGKISVTCSDCTAGMIRIEITDTGPGIPKNKQEMLFKPFERLGAEASTVEGTGIGLALSFQLAELMHGKLGMECQAGNGCTFWLELPKSV